MSSENRRKAIIHVGLPKTGTTAIQAAFYSVREALLQSERVLYPSIAECHTIPIRTLFAEDAAASSRPIPKSHLAIDLEDTRTRYKDAFETEMSRDDWDTLVISGEGIRTLKKADLEKLKAWLEKYCAIVQIVFVLRDPVSYTISSVQQNLKGGATLEDMFKTPPLPGWSEVLETLKLVFGEESLRVFAFEEAIAHEGGVVTHFSEAIGLNENCASILRSAQSRANESISYEAAQVLNKLNHVRPFFKAGARQGDRSGHELAAIRRLKGRKFDVPDEIKRQIFSKTRGDAKYARDHFGIKRYIYPKTKVENGAIDDELTPEFWESLSILIADLSNESFILRGLEAARRQLESGNVEGARARVRGLLGKFPANERLLAFMKKLPSAPSAK